MAEKYTYNITDFPNDKVNCGKLTTEIRQSNIVIALDYINANPTICDIWFKDSLSEVDTTTLDNIVAAHDGEAIPDTESPHTADGVPIVRSDSRALETETYFTMCGDSTGIGDGKVLLWDFSNDDDLFEYPGWVPEGFKAKKVQIRFNCPVYLKDGTMYFFDVPWGCYISMFVSVPANNYYPNTAGDIPASALGLSGNDMYSYTTVDIPYQSYVRKHHMFGTCQMGDELNAEGAALTPVPVGWMVCGLIVTPESDNVSRGFGSLEMYRCHTMLLPGQTIESIHS